MNKTNQTDTDKFWNDIAREHAAKTKTRTTYYERLRTKIRTQQEHAEKLAEALRRAIQWLSSYPGNGAEKPYEQARKALAAYDKSKGGE